MHMRVSCSKVCVRVLQEAINDTMLWPRRLVVPSEAAGDQTVRVLTKAELAALQTDDPLLRAETALLARQPALREAAEAWEAAKQREAAGEREAAAGGGEGEGRGGGVDVSVRDEGDGVVEEGGEPAEEVAVERAGVRAFLRRVINLP